MLNTRKRYLVRKTGVTAGKINEIINSTRQMLEGDVSKISEYVQKQIKKTCEYLEQEIKNFSPH